MQKSADAAAPPEARSNKEEEEQDLPRLPSDGGPESESDLELEAPPPGEPLPPGALEEGHIFFFYRPKVQQEHPESLDDVARFYMILQPLSRRPPPTPQEMPRTAAAAADAGAGAGAGAGGGKEEGRGEARKGEQQHGRKKQDEEQGGEQQAAEAQEHGEQGGKEQGRAKEPGLSSTDEATGEAAGGGGASLPCRLVVIGKKRLPDAGRHERFFGFVEAVSDSVDKLTAGMGERRYSTRTRGERIQPAARAAGRGTYSLMDRLHGRTRAHTELAYVLQLPAQPGPVQGELRIAPSARYVLQIKNPTNQPPGRPSAGPEPAYSPAQAAAFAGGNLWVGAEDVSLLDVVGTELVLIGAREQPLEATGEAAAQHLLQTTRREVQQAAAAAHQGGAEAGAEGAGAPAAAGAAGGEGGNAGGRAGKRPRGGAGAGEQDVEKEEAKGSGGVQSGGSAGGEAAEDGGSGGGGDDADTAPERDQAAAGGAKRTKVGAAAGKAAAAGGGAAAAVLAEKLREEVAAVPSGGAGEEGEDGGEGAKAQQMGEERIPTAPAETGQWA